MKRKKKCLKTLANSVVRKKFANKYKQQLFAYFKTGNDNPDIEFKMKIVKLARKQLGYSNNTSSNDIMFGLYKLASSADL
jgi:hypothetical protein